MAVSVKSGRNNDTDDTEVTVKSTDEQNHRPTLHVGHAQVVNRSARTQTARLQPKASGRKVSRLTVSSPGLTKARFNRSVRGSHSGTPGTAVTVVPASVQKVAGRTISRHYIYRKNQVSIRQQAGMSVPVSGLLYPAAIAANRSTMADVIRQDTLRNVKKNAKLRVNGKAASQIAIQQGIQGLRFIGQVSAQYTATMMQKTANADSEETSDSSMVQKMTALPGIPHVSTKGLVTIDGTPESVKQTAGAAIREPVSDVRKLTTVLQKQNKDALMTTNTVKAGSRASSSGNAIRQMLRRIQRHAVRAAVKGAASILSALLGSAIIMLVMGVVIGVVLFFVILSMMSSYAATNLNGEAQAVYQFFHEKGLDDVHAAAIMGNIKQESGMNPAAQQANGEGIGLFQFSYSQKQAFLAYCEQQGVSWQDGSAAQLNWFWDNKYMTDTPGGSQAYFGWWTSASRSRFESTSELSEATLIFYDEYEGANAYGTDNTGDTRIQYAQEYLDAIQNGSLSENTDPNADGSDRLNALFPTGVPTSSTEMQAYLVTISVPVVDTDGNRSTTSITVHKDLAGTIEECFEEMADIGFPVHQAGGYSWRMQASGTGVLSHHSYGVVVDINWSENPAVYWGASPDSGSPYYINQDVVDIWKSHGFYWGGDWDGSYNDPMHFTYTNH